MELGVNIDHIAVLREARRINSPNILQAVFECENAGANHITVHLREDRRHINDFDVENIIKHSPLKVNLECSLNKEIIDIVVKNKPYMATIVPEKRQELTTEGGLDILNLANKEKLKRAIDTLNKNYIKVSLFIDPNTNTVETLKDFDINNIEFHTGEYCNIYAMAYSNLSSSTHSIKNLKLSKKELKTKLKYALINLQTNAKLANSMGINVAGGHGLNYFNMDDILKIKEFKEFNIGQSIIARSVFVGLNKAIRQMKDLINLGKPKA